MKEEKCKTYRRYAADESKGGRSFWSYFGNCFGGVRDLNYLSGYDWDIDTEMRVAKWIDESRQNYGQRSNSNFQNTAYAQTPQVMHETVSKVPENDNHNVAKQAALVTFKSENAPRQNAQPPANNRKNVQLTPDQPPQIPSITQKADTETASRTVQVHAELVIVLPGAHTAAWHKSQFAARLGARPPSPALPPASPTNAWIVPVARSVARK